MNILLFFIVSLIVVLIVQLIMSVIYKDVEKKDKGFVFVYHKLTYRRKFIRGLMNIPLSAILYFAIYWFGDVPANELKMVGAMFLFLILLDLGYNYMKWKKSESLAK